VVARRRGRPAAPAAPRGSAEASDAALAAARFSGVPGVTRAQASARFGVSLAELKRARP